jgi:hypothetical protein
MLGTTDFLPRMRQAADGAALYATVIETEQLVLERLSHSRA